MLSSSLFLGAYVPTIKGPRFLVISVPFIFISKVLEK